MNTSKRFCTQAAVVLMIMVSGATLVGCDKQTSSDQGTAASGVTIANLADKVDQARTPADHQALAQYYDERARVTQRETAEEREARTRYERRWNSDDRPMGRGARDHFNHMIEGREGEASGYHAMAEWHRQMAAEPQGEPGPRE